MKNIFVDMDGVLCDFHRGYTEMFGSTPTEVRREGGSKYLQLWNRFVEGEAFTTLPPMPHAEELLDYLSSLDSKKYNICILSSSGGFHKQSVVMSQKAGWLLQNAPQAWNWGFVVVPGRRYKAGFADSNSMIIDDTYDVCVDFAAKGGTSIHYVDHVSSMEEIKAWTK